VKFAVEVWVLNEVGDEGSRWRQRLLLGFANRNHLLVTVEENDAQSFVCNEAILVLLQEMGYPEAAQESDYSSFSFQEFSFLPVVVEQSRRSLPEAPLLRRVM
jgi:hypothetical protein